MKKALITGITGQDGAYLADLLIKKGYEVHGIKRRSSLFNTDRIDHLYSDPHTTEGNLKLYYGDLTDATNIIRIIQEVSPDEIYNLGAMSHVKVSFDTPEYTANVDGLGTLRILEAVRLLGLVDKTKIYQASTSEMYGLNKLNPHNESSSFNPRSPYAAAKLYAYWITVNYREAYNMFAANGILFNHESPIRGETFVTRKITRAVCRMVMGLQRTCYLGNLNAKRDWGHAKDYVRAMWLILQQQQPDDFVIATGIGTSVRDLVIKSFKVLGIELDFVGDGPNEIGIVRKCNNEVYQIPLKQQVIKVDPNYYRPTEVDELVGDPTKAKEKLDWNPEINIDHLITEMINSDLELLKKEQHHLNGGDTSSLVKGE